MINVNNASVQRLFTKRLRNVGATALPAATDPATESMYEASVSVSTLDGAVTNTPFYRIAVIFGTGAGGLGVVYELGNAPYGYVKQLWFRHPVQSITILEETGNTYIPISPASPEPVRLTDLIAVWTDGPRSTSFPG